jgi:hypothetical protein
MAIGSNHATYFETLVQIFDDFPIFEVCKVQRLQCSFTIFDGWILSSGIEEVFVSFLYNNIRK